MPILTLQQASRELGRIRLGEFDPNKGAKGAPAKLDRFRMTSASQPLLDKVAALYGGQVRPWQPQGGGPAQYEVYTEATRIPVLVPPNPVSQWFELWSGGGCQRRCDGQMEMIGDSACLCDPESRQCQPTTRLNVVLRKVPGIGVWRLESHGFYAAVELPAVAEFLAMSRGYVSAVLTLTERVVKRIVNDKPQTRRFIVPAIEVEDVTPEQLMAGGAGYTTALSPGRQAELTQDAWAADQTRELLAAPYASSALESRAGTTVDLPGTGADDPQLWVDSAQGAGSLVDLSALLRDAQAAGYATDMRNGADPVTAAFLAARARLSVPTPTHAVAPAAEEEAPAPDIDSLWMQVLASAPTGWDTDKVTTEFTAFTDGVVPANATARDMARYLTHLRKVGAR
jgi:hypothetical protein